MRELDRIAAIRARGENPAMTRARETARLQGREKPRRHAGAA